MCILLFELFGTFFKFNVMFLIVAFHNSLQSLGALNDVMETGNPHVSLFVWRCTKRKLPLDSDKKKRLLPVFRKTYFKNILVGFETIDNWSKRNNFEFLIIFL